MKYLISLTHIQIVIQIFFLHMKSYIYYLVKELSMPLNIFLDTFTHQVEQMELRQKIEDLELKLSDTEVFSSRAAEADVLNQSLKQVSFSHTSRIVKGIF